MFGFERWIDDGWLTALVCVAGALALLAGLRRAIQRAEIALRDRLFVLLVAGGLVLAGVAPSLEASPGRLLEETEAIARAHPFTIAGIAFAVAIVLVATLVALWVRFWVRTLLRLSMLGAFVVLVFAWAIARFALVGDLDAWTSLALGERAWRAILDGVGVGFVVVTVLRLLGIRPSAPKKTS